MKIQPISTFNKVTTNRIDKSSKYSIPVQQINADLVNFGNYTRKFESILYKDIRSHSQLCDCFKELFSSATKTPNLKNKRAAYFFFEQMEKIGVYLMFSEMAHYSTSKRPGVSKEYASQAYNDKVTLVTDANDKPIMTYTSSDISLFSSDLDKQKPMVRFNDPDGIRYIEFSYDKNGNLSIDRLYSESRAQELLFYYGGGIKMKNDYNPFESSDITYYNRDGSKAFWKNLF